MNGEYQHGWDDAKTQQSVLHVAMLEELGAEIKKVIEMLNQDRKAEAKNTLQKLYNRIGEA